MISRELNRRQLLIATSVAGLGAIAQVSPAQVQSSPTAEELGAIHNDMLNRVSDVLAGEDPALKENLLKLVHLLRTLQVINPDQEKDLQELIEIIFAFPDPSKAAQKLEPMYNALRHKVNDVAAATVCIARESLQYAIKHKKQMSIVAGDVSGALTGAIQGRKLGPYAAVIGAVAGAITGSYLASTK